MHGAIKELRSTKWGRYQEAGDAFHQCLSINSKDTTAWNGKGSAFDQLEKYPEAMDAFDEALLINPDDANAWNKKAILLGKLGRYKEAIDCFDRSIGINPHNKDILVFHENALFDSR
jgi:tetratricopeptide (TPR) repeat protein